MGILLTAFRSMGMKFTPKEMKADRDIVQPAPGVTERLPAQGFQRETPAELHQEWITTTTSARGLPAQGFQRETPGREHWLTLETGLLLPRGFLLRGLCTPSEQHRPPSVQV